MRKSSIASPRLQASPNDCTNLCKELQSRIQIIERQQATASVSFLHSRAKNNLFSSSFRFDLEQRKSNDSFDTYFETIPFEERLGNPREDQRSDEENQVSTKPMSRSTIDFFFVEFWKVIVMVKKSLVIRPMKTIQWKVSKQANKKAVLVKSLSSFNSNHQ